MRIFKPKNSQPHRGLELVPRSTEGFSDEALVDAVTNGKVWAIEALYQRYHQMLYSLAYRMVSDHQVAEDLLQETFMAVWRNATTYASKSGSVRTWLFSIIHHRTIDYLRSVQRRAVLNKVPLDDVEQDTSATTPDAWEEAWRGIQGIHIREALVRLPKEQRMVIELAYFQGWTHVEIAEGCQIPLGTVKARMRLGLMRMRRLLAEMGVDEL